MEKSVLFAVFLKLYVWRTERECKTNTVVIWWVRNLSQRFTQDDNCLKQKGGQKKGEESETEKSGW